MKKSIFRKGMVFGIIVLFVGASLIPSINGSNGKIKDSFFPCEHQVATSSSSDWWPMFKHDVQNSGFSPSNAPETNNVNWTFAANDDGGSPVVYKNKVYLCIGDCFYCLNADNGSEIWSYYDIWTCEAAAVVNDRIYVQDSFNFYCLDANNGSLIWVYSQGAYSSPAVSNDKVYIGSEDHKVYCLNADNGSLIWSYTTGGLVRSSPAVSNDKVYVGSYDHKVYCLNADSGSMIWNYTTGNKITSSPAVHGGKVFIGSFDGKMYCLNAENGTEIWSFQIESGWIRPSPAIAYGNVYFAADDYHIYCLNADNGSEIWSYETTYGNYHSPAVADNKVYVGTSYWDGEFEYFIEGLDAFTGESVWSFPTNGEALAPAIANDKLYVCSRDGAVYCFKDENQPPAIPTITGPTSGTAGEEYTYNFTAVDPDGGEIYYYIDWGDDQTEDWFGPYLSGTTVQVSHIWDERDTYMIKCKVKDVFDVESDWGTLEVEMPVNQQVINPLLQMILERFPNAFPILRYLLGL